jgi:exopolysaccharide biosynthesis operon protein EpsL
MVLRISPRFSYPVAIAVLIFSQSALSAPDDALQPYVSTTYTYYSNLFLIPGDTPPGTPGVLDPVRKDSSEQVEGGLEFNNTYGLQNFTGYAKVNQTYFQHFTQLDYFGRDLLANWNWNVSSVLQGTLGATDTRSLGPFTDFHLQERNLLDESREYATADLLISPHWLLHTGLNRDESDFELPVQQINDNASNYKEIGVDYLGSNNGSIGFVYRHLVGNYPNYELFDGEKVTNSYSQDEYKLKVDWHFTGKTELTFLGGYVQRESDLSSLNVYGLNGRLVYIWMPTDKLKFNLTGWHEYSPIQTGEVGYSINTGISTETSWDVTSKINLAARLKYEKRDFYDFIYGAVTPYYDDATNNATVIAKYEPRQYLQFILMITHDLRSANIPEEGFVGNGASLSASLKF